MDWNGLSGHKKYPIDIEDVKKRAFAENPQIVNALPASEQEETESEKGPQKIWANDDRLTEIFDAAIIPFKPGEVFENNYD